MELSLELNLLPRPLSANLPDMRQDTPSTPTLVHSQAELLESLASLLHHIRHEGLEPRTHSFEFSKNPRQRLSLHFETLGDYLGSCLEDFEAFAIHVHFTRYIPQSLLEGVKALLQARNYILANTLLTET